MAAGEFDPERMLRVLEAAGVRFVLIGGMAAVLYGDVGVTIDLDVVPERSPDNLRRLAGALGELSARIRTDGVAEGLPFDCSAEFLGSLSPDAILNLTTAAGDLDLTFVPSGTRGYPDLKRQAVVVEVGEGVSATVAALADVIRSKEAAGREKDRAALPRLRRLLDRIGDRPKG